MHAAYYLVFNKDNVAIDDVDCGSSKAFQYHCSRIGCPNLTTSMTINLRCRPCFQ